MPSGPLDLSGADTSGIDPVPSGKYNLTVFEAEWTETKNEGKLPIGTDMFKVQFTIDSTYPDGAEEVDGMKLGNRRVFQNFFPIPPKGYDKDKAAKNKGSFVRFLVACGYDKEEIESGKFNLEVEDLIGKSCVATLKIQPGDEEKGYDPSNAITGFKTGEAVTSGGLL